MCGVLLHVSVMAMAQVGSIVPSQPKAGDQVVLRYDATSKAAVLDATGEVFATMQVVMPSGSIHRTVALRLLDDGTLEGVAEIPSGAICLNVAFASRWAVDGRARLRSMVYDGEGAPVQGARCHVALASRDRCLSVLAAELEAYPESYGAFRYKWNYNRLFRRDEFALHEVRRDLAEIGSADTPTALMALVYLHMMCADEKLARAALLRALKLAPKTWATAKAVGDYHYFARSGIGTTEGHSEVESAVHAAMIANPDSQLVRDHLYNSWMKFDFETVRTFTDAWLVREPQNPLPHAILAATSLALRSNLDAGRDAANRAMNGFLNGDGRITSLDTQSLGVLYLRWSAIVAAKIARMREDYSSAIAFAKAYVAYADDGLFGHECEARVWEDLHQRSRATECWLDAFECGSVEAKAALRRLWSNASGSDAEFDAHLTVLLQSRRSASERSKAPLFACRDLVGNPLDSQALHGRVVVLNFWGLGCMPCKKEIPSLNELAKAYAGKPVTFVAFSQDGADAVASYVRAHAFDYRLVADSSEEFGAFDVSSLPLHVVIDGEGRVLAKLPGAGPGQPARIASLIDQALAEL